MRRWLLVAVCGACGRVDFAATAAMARDGALDPALVVYRIYDRALDASEVAALF